MENNNNTAAKVLAVAALCASVGGLAIGFAAFSNTLVISSSAEYKASSLDFNVDFSEVTGSVVDTNGVTPSISGTEDDNFTVAAQSVAAIDNTTASTSKITNLHAVFTDPGQTVTYAFYAVNTSENYKAYLNSVTFGSAKPTCTPGEGADATLVAQACEGISLKVTVGGDAFTATNPSISSHSLAANNGSETVTVDIDYAAGSVVADGDFDVTFGDVTLIYGSTD